MTWTDERIEKLKELDRQGLSASMIAEQLRGVSRNAVIGKLHRLRLTKRTYCPKSPIFGKPPRPKFQRKEPATRTLFFGQPVPKIKLEPLPPPELQATDVGRVAFDDLEPHHCRYPIGNGPDLRFCGDSKFPGLPYCEHHARRCYRPMELSTKLNVKPTRRAPIGLSRLDATKEFTAA